MSCVSGAQCSRRADPTDSACRCCPPLGVGAGLDEVDRRWLYALLLEGKPRQPQVQPERHRCHGGLRSHLRLRRADGETFVRLNLLPDRIRRQVDLDAQRIEIIQIDQAILGCMFDVCTLLIAGAGSSQTQVAGISSPKAFREALIDARAARERAADPRATPCPTCRAWRCRPPARSRRSIAGTGAFSSAVEADARRTSNSLPGRHRRR